MVQAGIALVHQCWDACITTYKERKSAVQRSLLRDSSFAGLWSTVSRDVIRIAATQSSGCFHISYKARPDPIETFNARHANGGYLTPS